MKTWDEWLDIHRERMTHNVTEKTVIVMGCKRGGTSAVAGALRLLGVHMGDNIDPHYGGNEDMDIGGDQDLEHTMETVFKRNREQVLWGFKHPNTIDIIHYLAPFLINPYFITIYRDPHAIAQSEAKKQNKPYFICFWEAMTQLKKLQYFSMYPDSYCNNMKGISLSYELLLKDPKGSIEDLANFIDVPVNDDAINFINPEKGYQVIT